MRRSRLVSMVAAAAMILAGMVVGGGAAQASSTTGAITVMVVSPAKKAIRNDFDIETAAATVVTSGGKALVTKSPDANGRVTFSHVPAGSGYTILLRNAYGYSHYLQSKRAGVLEGLPTGDYTVEFDARRGGENEPGLLNYEWQFLSGATHFADAEFVHVAAETAAVPETQLTGVDATLVTGHSLVGKVFSSFPQDFDLTCQVHFVSTEIGSSFCTSMNLTGNGFSETLVPGDYRIEVTRPSTTRPGTVIGYWYAGEGVAPASSSEGAAVVHFAGSADRTITMTVH
jgi:hypothetical protein